MECSLVHSHLALRCTGMRAAFAGVGVAPGATCKCIDVYEAADNSTRLSLLLFVWTNRG